jgi:hypothetical protein
VAPVIREALSLLVPENAHIPSAGTGSNVMSTNIITSSDINTLLKKHVVQHSTFHVMM